MKTSPPTARPKIEKKLSQKKAKKGLAKKQKRPHSGPLKKKQKSSSTWKTKK